jgi:hypothetical protein
MNMKYPITMLAMLLTSAVCNAEELAHTYRSAYLLGRGDTGNALADDEDAIFYNPAGLALGTGVFKRLVLISPMLEASKNTKDLVRQTVVEKSMSVETMRNHTGKPQHVGLYNFTGLILRKAAFGVFTGMGTNVMIFKSKDNGGLETLAMDTQATQGLTLSYADGFWGNRLLAGVTGKYMYRGEGHMTAGIEEAEAMSNLDPSSIVGYGEGMGFDLGLIYRNETKFSTTSVGLQVVDVGDTKFAGKNDSTAVRPLPQKINLGFAVQTGTQYSRFKLLADYRDILKHEETNMFKRTHLGAEISVANFIGVTGGLNQGGPTAGMYFDMRLLRLDLVAYCEEVGEYAGDRTDLRYAVRIMAGF